LEKGARHIGSVAEHFALGAVGTAGRTGTRSVLALFENIERGVEVVSQTRQAEEEGLDASKLLFDSVAHENAPLFSACFLCVEELFDLREFQPERSEFLNKPQSFQLARLV